MPGHIILQSPTYLLCKMRALQLQLGSEALRCARGSGWSCRLRSPRTASGFGQSRPKADPRVPGLFGTVTKDSTMSAIGPAEAGSRTPPAVVMPQSCPSVAPWPERSIGGQLSSDAVRWCRFAELACGERWSMGNA